jgi:uncharacterized RDD family membrane protein YckC
MAAPSIPINYGFQDSDLTRGVMWRRIVAWWIDLALVGLLFAALWFALVVFGFLTLGLSLPLLSLMPLVPLTYHVGWLAAAGATPGQAIMGLAVRDNATLARPDLMEALISTIVFYATVAVSFLPLLITPFTVRRRTLHDLVSGLVVVRARAL